MKGQTAFIIGIIAAIIIAVFAVINVEAVPVNYLFGTTNWPLILVILGSVFLGAAVAGALGMMRVVKLQSEVKRLRASHRLDKTDTPASTNRSETNPSVSDTTKQS
ncbi:LapA family protein [Alkalicoccobacillus porphyridii]|uniref:LapA family protein n=1 Tax=Alkalicoccobacillus porphyridii TaxID=2597270 RepID=A0A553ZW35_9BACI|nr:LapA family protein [Alkalicoccobacillus porphyridii]TSB45690.1 LapA family protein [Alkalicoccobacillus porphyridii]